ncbi:LOW QUALITY PROTEIN: hypothetical protein MAR_035013 [Mya arenaria]|uniref:HTH CENPB-type domain-containing protein n=1 Tax=Mya arenaria TaxID=6604 RepID=A0ABY7EIW2_MYAAR|nr:LOW QUALITY PROTEIN: hypothetical protein MAR_035013 [Mya arenaria]
MSPTKREIILKALFSVGQSVYLRKAAKDNDLPYSVLRWAGDVHMFKVKRPKTILREAEEEYMTNWLSKVAQRGMGLRMCGVLIKREKRKVPFKGRRPGKKWYYSFMSRNSHIISTRYETDLEMKRSKVTKEKTDQKYNNFRDFVNKGKVIGPTRQDLGVPRKTSVKTYTFVLWECFRPIMPPYFVYSEPKPRGYNPIFAMFIDHFDRHAGLALPVVLLIVSVSSVT